MTMTLGLRDLLEAQAESLRRAGLPGLMGMTETQFSAKVVELGARLEGAPAAEATGNVRLCIAFRRGSVSLADVMARIEARSAKGIVDMAPLRPEAFPPVADLTIPDADLYLLVDVDTGREFLNISPEACLATIRARGRTPLTMEEGVALTLQHPALLVDKASYNCIQMPGSRRTGDQRVPSIWFSKGAPRLGWCWDRNVHTWLGSASAALRLG